MHHSGSIQFRHHASGRHRPTKLNEAYADSISDSEFPLQRGDNGKRKRAGYQGSLWVIVLESISWSQQNIWVRHIEPYIYNIVLLLFNFPLIAFMPTSFTHPSSSSQPRPSSSIGDTHGVDSDGIEEVSAAVWKRRYLALQESVNTEKSSKRKSQ